MRSPTLARHSNRHRTLRMPKNHVAPRGAVPESLSEAKRDLGGLVLAANKPRHRADGNRWLSPAGQLANAPAAAGRILLQQATVESHSYHFHETIVPISYHCQEQSFAVHCNNTKTNYNTSITKKHNKRYPKLKKYFHSLQTTKTRLNQLDFPRRAADKGFNAISYNRLRGLERGETRAIAPELLRQLAKFLDVDYGILVATVVQHIYGVELSAGSVAERRHIDDLTKQLGEAVQRRQEAEVQLDKLRRKAASLLDEESPPGTRAARS